MEEAIYQLTKLLPYFLLFPLSAIIVFIIFTLLSKKEVNQNNSILYGLAINLSNREIILISLLLLKLIAELESLFVMNFSYYSFIILLFPVIIYNIISFKFLKIIIDIIETLFIIVLLFFKNIFYAYIIEVNSVWYILALFISLCIFIICFCIYSFFINLKKIVTNIQTKNN